MKQFCIGKKLCSAIFCIVLVLNVFGQQHSFRLFPVEIPALQSQALIGSINTHFFLLNTDRHDSLSLYIYDTSAQKGYARQYPFPKQLLSVQLKEQSVVFMASSNHKKGVSYHLLELNGKGEVLRTKEDALPAMKGMPQVLTSDNKSYTLLYELIRKSNDSLQIHGTILNSDWDIKKQLQYSFKQDMELDATPETFLDNNGNTHVLVFDKNGNYRISSDLTVNTMPLAEEQIVSETFTFEKVKIKSMQVFQNNDCNCLQAEGMYVDGLSKTNKGIFSIAFPLGRKNELAPRFIPFTDDMLKNFRKGFAATEESILKSIQSLEMVYADEGSFAILRLNNGTPQQVQRNLTAEDPSTQSFLRSLNSSRATDYQLPSIATNTGGTYQRIRTTQIPADKFVNAAPVMGGTPAHKSPLSSRSTGRNAPKFICVKLSKEQGFEWYTSKSLDIFATDDQLYNHIFFIGGEKESLPLALYQANASDEPYPVLITMKPGGLVKDKFPEKTLVFSPIQFLARSQYASLYMNTETGIGGLLFIQTKNEISPLTHN